MKMKMKIKVEYMPEQDELVVTYLGNKWHIRTKEFLDTLPF